MAEKYDNGYNSSDFKRNSNQDQDDSGHHEMQDGEDGGKLNEKAGEYMRELLSEKIKLNSAKFPISSKLIDQEVAKVQATGKIALRDNKSVDVYREKLIKVTVKVLVPIKEYPKFNFVGKLLGPKGNTLKQLQDETMCKMAVLGRGSMRDRQKEEELRNSLDPKYAHLSDELHVGISALAPPAEAHARIAYALAEVKKYLIPDSNDMIRQNQMREMFDRDADGSAWKRGGASRVQYSACTVTARSYSYGHPVVGNVDDAGGRAEAPPGRAPPRIPPSPMARTAPHNSKMINILDRARSAMESSYGYDDPYATPREPPVRGPPRAAPEPEFYYEREHERFCDDEPYYKEESRDYKASARDVGTRRSGSSRTTTPYARASPYQRHHKTNPKERPQ